MSKKSILQFIFISFVFAALTAGTALAQGNAFSFQGRLNDGTNAANGSYDLQFRLYDAIAGGTQIGAVVARPNTTLINGVFSVALDFGATAFNNPNSIFIEISVRPNGSPNAYTILGPRQQLTVVPFAVRAANATNADSATNAQNSVNSQNSINSTNAINSQNSVNATNSQNSVNATNATNATTATTANNALNLGGVAANGYARLGGVVNQGSLNIVGILSASNSVNTNGDMMALGSLLVGENARQFRTANGFVKAMIYVSATGQIMRCYNGDISSGTSTGNCGFTITHTALTGVYLINFGFQVNDRFYSIMTQKGGNQSFIGSYEINGGLNNAEIRIFISKSHESGSSSGADAEFTFIVF